LRDFRLALRYLLAAVLGTAPRVLGTVREAEQEEQACRIGIRQTGMTSIIDAFDFARQAREASGSMPLVRFQRAAEDLPMQPRDSSGDVRWSVRGEMGKHGGRQGEMLLHLHIQANPVVICQRCMQAFAYPIDFAVSLHLVKSEAQLDVNYGDDTADDSDGGLDDEPDAPEKVVGSRRFDLLAQIEDELILSIPYVPRHEVCPGPPAKTDAGEPVTVERPSPFAVLEKLKQKV
jgi:uncharacterized protein